METKNDLKTKNELFHTLEADVAAVLDPTLKQNSSALGKISSRKSQKNRDGKWS